MSTTFVVFEECPATATEVEETAGVGHMEGNWYVGGLNVGSPCFSYEWITRTEAERRGLEILNVPPSRHHNSTTIAKERSPW